MAADSGEIGKGVLIASLGTVVGGLALALALRSLGYLSAVGRWVAGVFAWLWHALIFPVPVPLVVSLVVVGIVAYSLRVCYVAKQGTTPVSAQLSADEEAIIRLMVQLDGQWAALDDIAARTHRSKLVTGRALALLHDRGFIDRAPGGTLYPPRFGLDGAGIEYAYRAGYVR